MKVVYFDHDRADPEPPFRQGEAGAVWTDAEGLATTRVDVDVSANSLHALHGHGVVEALNGLPLLIGPIAPSRDAVVAPGGVERALRILYEADRMTYGARHDLLVARVDATAPIEYRIVIDNREYQRTLSQLQFLCGNVARRGQGVRLRL